MTRFIRIFTVLAIAFALMTPLPDIQASAAPATQLNGHRGGKTGNKGNNSAPNRQRPGGKPGKHGGSNPGRPGGNHPGRPANPPRPPKPPRPQNPPKPPRPSRPPRPHRPYYPIHVPTRPYGYVPYRYAPVINSILGLQFGLSVANSIATLINNGYTIDYYDNTEVSLINVRNMNYLWDNAILQYNSAGRFNGACFYYSSPIYDLSRYTGLYNTLCGQFGSPVSNSNVSGIIHTSWFDKTGNNFITLSFGSGTGTGSGYYTTLSFGTNN